MEPRISLVTLGVADLERALRFYWDGLGWRPSGASVEGVVAFFQLGGLVLSLWSRDELARDAGVDDAGGWGGVTLDHNVRTRGEVDEVMATVARAGGRVLRPAAEMDWDGYSGYVADPDGHAWEIAWNPGFPMRLDGTIQLPD